jgi:cytoskeletal protein CcmA (bactofilin family)
MISLRKGVYWGVLLSLVVIFCLSVPTSVQAFESDSDGRLEKGETIEDDLLLAAGRVVVDGVVKGDLYATANTIVLNGVVEGSVFFAAQTIEVNGTIKGSLYGTSQSMTLGEAAQIKRNLFYAGFAFHSKPGSQVGKDALMVGYQAVLDGQIQRDLLASVGALEVSGEIGRNVKVNVGDPEEGSARSIPFSTAPNVPPMIPSGLRINETAKIGGTLTYSSVKDQSQGIKSKPQGEIVFKPIQAGDSRSGTEKLQQSLPYRVGKYILNRLQELVTLFAIGLVGIWLLPRYLQDWKERMQAEPLAAGLNGLLTVLVGYIGAGLFALVLLAIGIFMGILTLSGLSKTVLGIGFSTLGLAVAIFSLGVTYGSKIVVCIWVGEKVFQRFAPQSAHRVVLVLLVGVLIYVIVRSIPILGWVIGLLATLVGVGAIYLALRERIRLPEKSSNGVESAASVE